MIERIVWLKKLKEDSLVGKKAENLNNAAVKNFPVPGGFVVTADAYKEFISKIWDRISGLLVNAKDEKKLEQAANDIQRHILNLILPLDTEWGIRSAYDSMDVNVSYGKKIASDSFLHTKEKEKVCVRGSQLVQDNNAPKLATFVNIKGVEQLKQAVKAVWASQFTADAISYRIKNNIKHNEAVAAVIVQKMVLSEKSGFAYSINPSSGKNEIVVEAVKGFSAGLAEFIPSTYFVEKKNNRIKAKDEKEQRQAYFSAEKGRLMLSDLPFSALSKPALENEEILKVAELAKDIESAFNSPMKIEFAFEQGSPYVIDLSNIPIKQMEDEMREEFDEEDAEVEEFDEKTSDEEQTEEQTQEVEKESSEEESSEAEEVSEEERETEEPSEEETIEEPAEEETQQVEEVSEEEPSEEEATEESGEEETAEEEISEETAEEVEKEPEEKEELDRDYEQRLNELFEDYTQRVNSILQELKEEALQIVRK